MATAEDEAAVVEAASVATASVAADAAEAEGGAVPAATPPKRRLRGRASATCGGDEDQVVIHLLRQRIAIAADPVYNIT